MVSLSSPSPSVVYWSSAVEEENGVMSPGRQLAASAHRSPMIIIVSAAFDDHPDSGSNSPAVVSLQMPISAFHHGRRVAATNICTLTF